MNVAFINSLLLVTSVMCSEDLSGKKNDPHIDALLKQVFEFISNMSLQNSDLPLPEVEVKVIRYTNKADYDTHKMKQKNDYYTERQSINHNYDNGEDTSNNNVYYILGGVSAVIVTMALCYVIARMYYHRSKTSQHNGVNTEVQVRIADYTEPAEYVYAYDHLFRPNFYRPNNN